MAQDQASADSDNGDLLSRIQNRYDKLRNSERIVADFLRERHGTRLDASITELARTLGVSEATISRVSRALGYSGFQDMKLSLAQSASAGRTAYANVPVQISQDDSVVDISAKLSALFAKGLFETQKLLDRDRVERAVEALYGAKRIIFAGVGGAAAICDEAAHLLIKAGFNAAAYRDGYTQTIAASTLMEQSVLVGISHTGTTETVAIALRIARQSGAKTIAITSDPKSVVAESADIVLATWNSDDPVIPLYGDFLEGRINQLMLIDLLYLGLLFRAGKSASSALKRTGSALERHYRRHELPAER